MYTLSIPDKKYDRIEDKPFRRVDGNHRLLAIEKLIAEGQMRSNYLIPFCIIVFPDNVSMKDEKIIFHNINSKAVPIRSERLLEGIIVDSKDELSFSDKELDDSFGHEYLLARKVLKNKPLAIRKLKAIDLMYMLMFSSEVSQIAEFDSDEKNSESQVLSWGGASDYFTVFLSEKGFISKGAIEYSNVYSEVDTSAAHIFSHYLELGGVFPFHLSSTIFADPECWNVICDDNSVYQFTRKVKALPGGALFKYDNGCSVFLS